MCSLMFLMLMLKKGNMASLSPSYLYPSSTGKSWIAALKFLNTLINFKKLNENIKWNKCFSYILFIRMFRGANNCDTHGFVKNYNFLMRDSFFFTSLWMFLISSV